VGATNARSERRGSFVAAVALLLCLAPPGRAEEPVDCLACHGEKIDAAAFSRSAHGSLGCGACHGAITGYPHPTAPAHPNCAACHGPIVESLAQSVHGAAALDCPSCHGDVHQALPHTERKSPVHWTSLAATCAHCHQNASAGGGVSIPTVRPVEAYSKSVHARAVADGRRGAVCADCHGSHGILPAGDPRSPLARANVPATCGACHAAIVAAYRESVHGEALARGVRDAPVCTDCHGEHAILAHTEPASPVFAANIAGETCGRCHASIRLGEKYGLAAGRVTTFTESYHGLALRSGRLTAANCASCHGVHDIQPSRDPRSHVNAANLPATCGRCHPGAGTKFALGPVHVSPTASSASIVGWVRFVYLWLIGIVVGAMAVHNGLDLVYKARHPRPPAPAVVTARPPRMSRALRWQHGLVMVSFPTLVYTGFALKYPESWWAAPLLHWETQLGLRGWLHRAAALVLLAALAWHALHLATSRRLRACLSGLRWTWSDPKDAVAAITRAFGGRTAPHHAAQFSYIEKVEYWAFLWGTVVMAVTGFLLWFENTTLRYLPKWATDVATAIHFYEAILATAAIVVWHFYWVMFDPDVYPMDTSWWHGHAPAGREPAISEEGGLQE
jgi:cytochrome b subunit of formate dehydrogenase